MRLLISASDPRSARRAFFRETLGYGVCLLLFVGACTETWAQSVRHVATDGADASDCLDANSPCLTIAHALSVADSGDTIDIAAGSYKPDPGPPATGLVIDKDITLQGAGPQETWIVRSLADPVYRLITIDSDPGGHQVVISGLRLRLGMADGAGESGRGGAIYNLDASGSLTLSDVILDLNQARLGGGLFNGIGVSPVIENSTFEGNLAGERGGAMYNWTDSAPQLTNVQFISNQAGIFGGALFNGGNNALSVDGGSFSQNSAVTGCGAVAMKNTATGAQFSNTSFVGNSTQGDGGAFCLDATSPVFTDVNFQSNFANGSEGDNNGGAMWLFNASSPQLLDVTFTSNSSGFHGGAIHSASGSSASLVNVDFEGNSALQGGAMHNTHSSSPALTNVTFSNNTAWANGGGMYNSDESHPSLENVTFIANHADQAGGGMYNTNASSPIINNSRFVNNIAMISGGGIANDVELNDPASNPIVTHVVFDGNEARGDSGSNGNGGGGVYNRHCSPVFKNVEFRGNSAAPQGGGMFNVNSSPEIINTLFYGNLADLGGGINNDSNGTATLTNVSFSGNQATNSGGALANSVFGDAVAYNTIFWGNSAANGNEIHVSGTSTLTLQYSLYSNGPNDKVVDGTLMCIECTLNADPLFANASIGNLRLTETSPAIDAGWLSTNPSLFPTDGSSVPIDLFGWPRFYGTSIDMGVNEWQPRPDEMFSDRFESP